MQISENFYTFAGKCHSVIIKPSLMELSNFNKQMEQSIIATIEGKLTRLPFIKAGINRLLYPKVHNKNALKESNACFISDKDRHDDTVMCFCEYVFFHYGIFDPIFNLLWTGIFEDLDEGFLHFLDFVNRNFGSIKYKYFASFDDVHTFFVKTGLFFRPSWLEFFGFSTKTQIEIRDLIFDDNERKVQRLQHILTTGVGFKDAMEFIDREKAFSETSHRHFVEIINREDYPPLFFAILIYNYIDTLRYHSTLLEPVFIKKGNFCLRTWPMGYDAIYKLMIKAQKVVHDDFKELFQNKDYFSDCKFMGWGDDWLDQFDSSENNYRFASWIRTGGRKELYAEQQEELDEELDNSLLLFLVKRGWKVPGFNPSSVQQKINEPYLKKCVESELEHLATAYSIVHDILSDERKAMINWLLERTHYNTIFNKLVEDFTTKYILKDSVPDSNDTVEKPGINESISIGGTTTNDETTNANSNNTDFLYIRVLNEKIPGPESERVSRRRECLEKLYCILIEREYIDENTDKELFLYRFTGLGEPYSKDQTICWKGVDRLLGYIARCLFTYRNSGTEGLGKFGELFEDEDGNHPYLPSAKHIKMEEYYMDPGKRSYQQFKEAIEILQECGFINVENTSRRGRK